MVEPLLHSPHNHLVVAWSISPICNSSVHIQVMNTGPLPIKLYKGTKMGTWVPRDYISIIEEKPLEQCNTGIEAMRESIQYPISFHLNLEEKEQLQTLLQAYSHLFVEHDPRVTHSINTTGQPVKQPNRRIPIKACSTNRGE